MFISAEIALDSVMLDAQKIAITHFETHSYLGLTLVCWKLIDFLALPWWPGCLLLAYNQSLLDNIVPPTQSPSTQLMLLLFPPSMTTWTHGTYSPPSVSGWKIAVYSSPMCASSSIYARMSKVMVKMYYIEIELGLFAPVLSLSSQLYYHIQYYDQKE